MCVLTVEPSGVEKSVREEEEEREGLNLSTIHTQPIGQFIVFMKLITLHHE